MTLTLDQRTRQLCGANVAPIFRSTNSDVGAAAFSSSLARSQALCHDFSFDLTRKYNHGMLSWIIYCTFGDNHSFSFSAETGIASIENVSRHC